MNKQEAIEKIKNLKGLTILDKTINFDSEMISKKDVLNIVKQLDEPVKPPEPKPLELEKPVVPKYVADWLEVCKDNLPLSLAHSMNNIIMMSNNQPDKTIHWIAKNPETFAKAWIYGYEIEHEQQYVVVIPDDGRNGFIQLWKNREGKLLFNFEAKIKYGKVHLLTEQEIKQKDERLWKFAEEVK